MNNEKLEENGTLERNEKNYISLSKVIEELLEDLAKKGIGRSECIAKRNYTKRFGMNLQLLLGKDFSEKLKRNNHFAIPISSKGFVKQLISPNKEFKEFLEQKSNTENYQYKVTVDELQVEAILQYDSQLREIRFAVYNLFGLCDKEVQEEVMVEFYKKYNPYYRRTEQGIEKIKELLDRLSKTPSMDMATCRTLHDDVMRCIQDIDYSMKRGKMLWLFEDDLVNDFLKLEYHSRLE